MSETYKGNIRYERGFDAPIASDGVVYRYVSRQEVRWVVNGRILEPGDPAEPKLKQISSDRPRFFGVTT